MVSQTVATATKVVDQYCKMYEKDRVLFEGISLNDEGAQLNDGEYEVKPTCGNSSHIHERQL